MVYFFWILGHFIDIFDIFFNKKKVYKGNNEYKKWPKMREKKPNIKPSFSYIILPAGAKINS